MNERLRQNFLSPANKSMASLPNYKRNPKRIFDSSPGSATEVPTDGHSEPRVKRAT